MKREGYYGLFLAALAILVLYLLNKAGLLHNSQYSFQDDAATLKEMADGKVTKIGTQTAVVSAKVGGISVGSDTTTYSDLAPASDAVVFSGTKLWRTNTF